MPHSATSTPIISTATSSTATALGPIHAARLGHQAYSLLATGSVEKSTPALAAALHVTEQQALDAMAAYLYVTTGYDLSEGRVLSAVA